MAKITDRWMMLLRHQGARGVGKTYHAACAAQAVGRGAILVCRSAEDARRIKADHPGDYEAVSIHNSQRLMGAHQDFVFDPDAYLLIVEQMARDHAQDLADIKAERKPKEAKP